MTWTVLQNGCNAIWHFLHCTAPNTRGWTCTVCTVSNGWSPPTRAEWFNCSIIDRNSCFNRPRPSTICLQPLCRVFSVAECCSKSLATFPWTSSQSSQSPHYIVAGWPTIRASWYMYRCDIHTDSWGDTLDRYITVAQVIGLLGTFVPRVSSGEPG